VIGVKLFLKIQGRFKAILVDHDACLLELSRYIVLNPVRTARQLKELYDGRGMYLG